MCIYVYIYNFSSTNEKTLGKILQNPVHFTGFGNYIRKWFKTYIINNFYVLIICYIIKPCELFAFAALLTMHVLITFYYIIFYGRLVL